MLPTIHPMEKTKVEAKRGVQRLELFIANNPSDEKAKEVLTLLKNIVEILK